MDLKGMGRDVGYTTLPCTKAHQFLRSDEQDRTGNDEQDSETSINARIVFTTICKGRFKPVGSERGIPERQAELWMDLGGVFVQLTKGTLGSSRGQQVK